MFPRIEPTFLGQLSMCPIHSQLQIAQHIATREENSAVERCQDTYMKQFGRRRSLRANSNYVPAGFSVDKPSSEKCGVE